MFRPSPSGVDQSPDPTLTASAHLRDSPFDPDCPESSGIVPKVQVSAQFTLTERQTRRELAQYAAYSTTGLPLGTMLIRVRAISVPETLSVSSTSSRAPALQAGISPCGASSGTDLVQP